jgi:RecA-family ATPase
VFEGVKNLGDTIHEFAPKPKAPPADLRLIDPITLHDKAIPERRWLVPDWIPWHTVTGLYGDGGLGKSLLAQQLMTATSIGKPWVGLSATRVRSLGVFCEDHEDELHRRQAAINEIYGCSFADLEDMKWLPRFGMENLLMTFEGGVGTTTVFWSQLLNAARDFGAQLLIIDTVADTFGGNENDRGQVRQYVSTALGSLAREIDGCVLALAHPSRAGMFTGSGDSGSTGWSNTFRSRAFLHAPETEEGAAPDLYARILSRKKANYALREDEIKLRWQQGVFVRSDLTETGFVGSISRRKAERVFLELLDAVTEEGRPVSDSSHAPNYAPKLFAMRPERDGYAKADFVRAMERLFASRAIEVVEYGRASDQRRKIARNPNHNPAREFLESIATPEAAE